jgi:hypothetical protein
VVIVVPALDGRWYVVTARTMFDKEPDAVRKPMVTYALRRPKPVIGRLRAAAENRDIKVSTLMREWLEERLASD